MSCKLLKIQQLSPMSADVHYTDLDFSWEYILYQCLIQFIIGALNTLITPPAHFMLVSRLSLK